WPITALGAFTLALGPPLIWTGARVFANRRPYLSLMAIGPLLFILSVAIDPAYRPRPLTNATGLGVASIYLALAAIELYRQRAERLHARWPLIAFLLIHAT